MYDTNETMPCMYLCGWKALVEKEKVSSYQFPFIYPIQIRLAVSYTFSSIFFTNFSFLLLLSLNYMLTLMVLSDDDEKLKAGNKNDITENRFQGKWDDHFILYV